MMKTKSNFRCGVVALCGLPNTGKSTLMNRLIGQKIAITSAKPQTTRGQIRTVLTDQDAQMVFIDTPGIHIAKNKLGEYMVRAWEGALKDIDAVLMMTVPARETGEAEKTLLAKLERERVPVLVVVNKADSFDGTFVSETVSRLQKEAPFAEVFPVSALRGQGVDGLLDRIRTFLPYGEPLYDEDAITDEPVRDIAAEIIREKTLRLLNDEVPHGIAVTIEKMRERVTKEGVPITDVEASIICEKDTHKGIVIGKQAAMLKKIGSLARQDIETLLEQKVNLQLFVKVRKDWRNDPAQLKGLGYR